MALLFLPTWASQAGASPDDLGDTDGGAVGELGPSAAATTPTARPDPQGGAGSDRYATEIMALGPLSYWRLGEASGTVAVDETGANDGTYVGPTQGAAGALAGDVDPAADFDGVDDYVDVGTFDISGTGLTLCGWMNFSSTTMYQARLVSKASDIEAEDHVWMLSTTLSSGDLRLRGRVKAGAITDTRVASSGNIQIGQWVFAVMTYDETIISLYLDGVPVGSWAHSSGGPVDTDPALPVWIGNNPPLETSKPMDGQIDEVAVFSRALAIDEIRMLYAAGRQYYTVDQGTTLSVTPNEGVIVNDTDPEGETLTAGLVSGPAEAASFTLNGDGSFDYTPNPYFTGTDSFVYQVCDPALNCANASVTITVIPVPPALSGVVFEDVNFAGVASAYDGGGMDLALANVDVELYDALDNYLVSTSTAGDGSFSFTGLADGDYKVRVRSSSLGDADTPPQGGFNTTVPGTWPYPLPELTWGNGVAMIGGQDHTVDDTTTGDNAGPGDTFATVTISGPDVSGVNFGFCFELIVNVDDDANADNIRSKQGTLRQFIKNSNAISGLNKTWFQIPGI